MTVLNRIRVAVRNTTGNLPAHGFGHLERTAIGAVWLTKDAGILHDIVRPPTEKIDHTADSLREAKKILANVNIGKTRQKRIIDMISAHRTGGNDDAVNQPVFLSDKLFEQSGAYICFRRCMFLGESADYNGVPFKDAVTAQFGTRMKKFKPSGFPRIVRKIASYQYGWQ